MTVDAGKTRPVTAEAEVVTDTTVALDENASSRLLTWLPSPRRILWCVLIVRLLLLLALHVHSHAVGEEGFNAAPYGGSDDGRYYYDTARQLANGEEPSYVLNAFPVLIAGVMKLGITDLLVLKLLSFLVSSIGVVVLAALAMHLTRAKGDAAQRWAVLLVSGLGALFPSNVFWSLNSFMRDGWILSFVLVFLWATTDAAKAWPPFVRHPRARLVTGLVALGAAGSFRYYLIPVAVAAVTSAHVPWLNPMRKVRPRVVPVVARLAVVSLGFIVLSLLAAPVIERVSGFNILGWRSRPDLLGKGSSLGYVFDGAPPLEVVGMYFVSVVSNAFGPLPWQIKSANQLLVLVEVPFFLVICAALFRARWSDVLVRLCGFFALYWLLLLGLWNDVLGNAARNRVIAWPLLALVAAVSLAERWSVTPVAPGQRRWFLRQLLPPRTGR